MKTIIAGSREITDYSVVCAAIQASGFTITEVVSGRARGVDLLGERWAAEHKIPIRVFPADWRKHGKAAGPIRNGEMARYVSNGDGGQAIIVWDGVSRGSADMARQAKENGLNVFVYRVDAAAGDQ